MSLLHIQPTKNTPEILFDTDASIYRVVGHSIPENAGDFYTPIIGWLKDSIGDAASGSVFQFCLPYFNSSSLKAIYMVLMEIKKEADTGKHFEVDWHIEEDDDFMSEAAETFTEMVGIKMNLRQGPLDDMAKDKKVA